VQHDDPAAWSRCGLLWSHLLTDRERASIAFAALRTLDPEAREAVFAAAHWGQA
jgi:hypothetical protein